MRSAKKAERAGAPEALDALAAARAAVEAAKVALGERGPVCREDGAPDETGAWRATRATRNRSRRARPTAPVRSAARHRHGDDAGATRSAAGRMPSAAPESGTATNGRRAAATGCGRGPGLAGAEPGCG